MLATEGRRILFIHVGKCAGESIGRHLYSHLDDRFTLFEMHVYNANQLIEQALRDNADQFDILIAKREPVGRFVSAFNWDKHNLHFKEKEKETNYDKWYKRFPTVNELGIALGSDDPETRDSAFKFSHFAHMGFGQAWYTPLPLLQSVPADRMFVVDVASLADDLDRLYASVLGHVPERKKPVPQSKGDYQSNYENGAALFPTYLSEEARRNIELRLADDFAVYNWLSRTPLGS